MSNTESMSVSANKEILSPSKVLLAGIASSFGWALDLFDLFVLLYVAPVIGRLFFPASQPTLSLAAVYASFAVALFVRPIGSAIFGHYADKHGRKLALTVAMVGVGGSTTAFGLLPTIHSVGFIAPILFLILRVVQGIFVGGIVASTHTIGTESISPQYRGMMSGIIGGGGAGLGALLASGAYFLISSIFPGDLFDQWGWRCMFFCGVISIVFGLLMSRFLEETPLWKQLQGSKKKNNEIARRSPMKQLMEKRYRKMMFANIIISFCGGATYYLAAGYLPTLLDIVSGVDHAGASKILLLGSIGTIVGALFIGGISDYIGRKKAIILIGVLGLIFLPFLFLNIASPSYATVMMLAIAIATIAGGATAPILIFLNERFPTELRALGTGLSWNIGFALGGALPTLVSLLSSEPAQIPLILTVFTTAISALYLIAGIVVKPSSSF